MSLADGLAPGSGLDQDGTAGAGPGPVLGGHLVPGAPGPVELVDAGQAVMGPRGGVPAAPGAVPDEGQEAGPPARLDEELGDRVPLAVEAHQVVGIFLDREEPFERQVAPSRDQVEDDLVVA